MTVRSNPRILLLFAIIGAAFAAGALGFIFLTAVFGIIFLAIGAFLTYQFFRVGLAQMRSKLITDDEGVTFYMATKEQEHFAWAEISHSGLCTPARGRPFAFVYSSDRDRLITIPREYDAFDEFLGELARRVEYLRFELDPGATVHEKLREHLGIPEPTAAGDTDDAAASGDADEEGTGGDSDDASEDLSHVD